MKLPSTEFPRVLSPHTRRPDVAPAIILVDHVFGADHCRGIAALDVPQLTLALKRDYDLGIIHGDNMGPCRHHVIGGQFGLMAARMTH